MKEGRKGRLRDEDGEIQRKGLKMKEQKETEERGKWGQRGSGVDIGMKW